MSYWTRVNCPKCGILLAWCKCKNEGQQMTDIHGVIAELKELEAKEDHTLADQLDICNHMSDLLRYTLWCEEKICELEEELATCKERDE